MSINTYYYNWLIMHLEYIPDYIDRYKPYYPLAKDEDVLLNLFFAHTKLNRFPKNVYEYHEILKSLSKESE